MPQTKRLKYITEEEAEKLIRDHRIVSTLIQGDGDFSRGESPVKAPEVYIAKKTTSGSSIAARSGTTPGQAECTLYRVRRSDDTIEALPDTRKIAKVYNLSTTAIADTEYFLAIRTKDGRYIAAFSAGGGGGNIWQVFTAILTEDLLPRASAAAAQIAKNSSDVVEYTGGVFEVWDESLASFQSIPEGVIVKVALAEYDGEQYYHWIWANCVVNDIEPDPEP